MANYVQLSSATDGRCICFDNFKYSRDSGEEGAFLAKERGFGNSPDVCDSEGFSASEAEADSHVARIQVDCNWQLVHNKPAE